MPCQHLHSDLVLVLHSLVRMAVLHAKQFSKVQEQQSVSRLLPNGADWIEHALEIGGVSYLKTPEEELSWIVLNNVDVYAAFAAAAAAALVGIVLALRRSPRSFMQAPSAIPNSSKKTL